MNNLDILLSIILFRFTKGLSETYLHMGRDRRMCHFRHQNPSLKSLFSHILMLSFRIVGINIIINVKKNKKWEKLFKNSKIQSRSEERTHIIEKWISECSTSFHTKWVVILLFWSLSHPFLLGSLIGKLWLFMVLSSRWWLIKWTHQSFNFLVFFL